MKKDELARKFKWLILCSGEAYTKQVTSNSEILILKEPDNTWTVWRGKWVPGDIKPVDEKLRLSRATFERALIVANEYVDFFESLRNGR